MGKQKRASTQRMTDPIPFGIEPLDPDDNYLEEDDDDDEEIVIEDDEE